MELLSKNEVTVVRSSERKKELDEGMKLARKIDSLRELHSKEETSLIKFRDESLKRIKDDIEELNRHKESIKSDITVLEGRREKALVPIDKELSLLETCKKDISKRHELLDSRELEILSKSNELSSRENKVDIEESRIEGMKQAISATFQNAQKKLSESESILIDTKNKSAIIKSKLDKREEELALLGKGISSREIDIENKISWIVNKEKELRDRERAVNDKYDTLQRTINRLKK